VWDCFATPQVKVRFLSSAKLVIHLCVNFEKRIMKEIVLRYVDHYLTKSIKHKVIMACLLGGIGIINPGLWGAFLQSRLNIYLGINQNNSIYIGVGLIIFSLLLLIHDMYFTFLPTSFSTQKTSRCIYLGVNR